MLIQVGDKLFTSDGVDVDDIIHAVMNMDPKERNKIAEEFAKNPENEAFVRSLLSKENLEKVFPDESLRPKSIEEIEAESTNTSSESNNTEVRISGEDASHTDNA